MSLRLLRLLFFHGLLSFSIVCYGGDDEDKLLLAYIYNLGKFIEWPEDQNNTEESIEICFYGDIGELSTQTKALDKKTIKNQPISTKELSRGEDISDCQIIFISESEEIYFKPLLNKLKNKSVLTISTTESFIRADGMVALIYTNDKLRFDINKREIEISNMKVSSQILRLARKVIE